eukprot:TRINITY_DN37982_c0_g1_i1.p1 TRINITY_DN37982_c0_g1~~TRINITY_DN37982_c0_g1_i1.p1  ORF type:complete len:214 (+),score=-20.26 TRINITY_DN37982_c0_g1_i1:207-848(+)
MHGPVYPDLQYPRTLLAYSFPASRTTLQLGFPKKQPVKKLSQRTFYQQDVIDFHFGGQGVLFFIFLFNLFFICVRSHQPLQITDILQLNFDNPSFFIRRFIYQFRGICQCLIEFDHVSSYWHIKVGSRFHRFNRSESFSFIQRLSLCLYFNVNDFAQFALCIFRNTNITGITIFYAYPFVIYGIFWWVGCPFFYFFIQPLLYMRQKSSTPLNH